MSEVSKNIKQAMAKLEETKKWFWKNHELRMEELNAAVESLNQTLETSRTDDDSNRKKLEESLRILNDL